MASLMFAGKAGAYLGGITFSAPIIRTSSNVTVKKTGLKTICRRQTL